MSPHRVNILLKVALAVIVVGAIGGLFVANKKLQLVAQDTAKQKAKVEIGERQIKIYQQTKKQVDSLGYVNDLANEVLPPTEDQSAVVAELSEFANRSRLYVSQITFPAASKTAAAAPSGAAPAAGAAASKTSTTPKGVLVTPVTIQFKDVTNFEGVIDFLRTTESTKRKSQVTNIAIIPNEKDHSVLTQIDVSMNLYTRQPKEAK